MATVTIRQSFPNTFQVASGQTTGAGNITGLAANKGILMLAAWSSGTALLPPSSVTLGGVNPTAGGNFITVSSQRLRWFWWENNTQTGTQSLSVTFSVALSTGGAKISVFELNTPIRAGNSTGGADPYTFTLALTDPSVFVAIIGTGALTAPAGGYTVALNDTAINTSNHEIDYRLTGNTGGSVVLDGTFSQAVGVEVELLALGNEGLVNDAVNDVVIDLLEDLAQ